MLVEIERFCLAHPTDTMSIQLLCPRVARSNYLRRCLYMTPKQKDLLRWIVEQVNKEKLPEAGIRFKFFPAGNSPTIENYEGEEGQIPATSLSTTVVDMFEREGYLKVGRRTAHSSPDGKFEIYECTLAIDAYTAAEVESQHFFPQGSSHDAYVAVREILRQASTSVTIVDPYLDETLFALLASLEEAKLSVQLLTSKVPPDFALEARKFVTQHSNIDLEVRKTKAFHDRFIILDGGNCYHVGASIRDAGRKVFMISRVEDQHNVAALLQQQSDTWTAASNFNY